MRRDAWVALAGLALLLAWDGSGLDLAAVHLFGNADGFAWRQSERLARIGHDGARWLGWALALVLFVYALKPRASLTARARWGWLLLTVGAAGIAPLLKQHSLTSCPWDLQAFGGPAVYVSHWRWGVADGGAGHCFPSGHASTAFVWLSSWFVLRASHPRAARFVLAAVLVAGALLGLVQLMRGAHYPSHTLWTAWLCWAFNAALAPLVIGSAVNARYAPAAP